MAMRRQTAKFAWVLSFAALALTAPASAQQADSSANPAVSGIQLALFGFGKSSSEPKPPRTAPKQPIHCPAVMVQPGTAAHIIYERGKDGDPMAVRSQVRFGDLARECVDLGIEVGVRIGFSGRALLGPMGKPGQSMDVPVRFVVIDDKQKVVLSQVTRLQVVIPPGQNGVTFTHVEELGGVAMPQGGLRGWSFRVGFDTKAPSGRPQG
jgi:hypothetical protein